MKKLYYIMWRKHEKSYNFGDKVEIDSWYSHLMKDYPLFSNPSICLDLTVLYDPSVELHDKRGQCIERELKNKVIEYFKSRGIL